MAVTVGWCAPSTSPSTPIRSPRRLPPWRHGSSGPRGRLRQAAIEREAREALPAEVVARLRRLGLLGTTAESEAMDELEDLQRSRAAVEQLQTWVEARLFDERDGVKETYAAAARSASPASSAER